MFSEDPADWIEYEKKQFQQILGRLTRMITGTLDPHLGRRAVRHRAGARRLTGPLQSAADSSSSSFTGQPSAYQMR
ncbi:hypothetical protein B7755_007365 [Streptomyces sp. NBS 14/10]|uniref:hypothetical protein n=1 Tax=Streptomyces sp. NBS 14/10 TaxID=1945643 RepID=UPI000B9D2A98|nr:hypothetical protein [Streptomyces sp. NBS 14/10]KAK1177983.1 hypothetical protein B7755_007365 [Streptomyces sp. NBS 14/10]